MIQLFPNKSGKKYIIMRKTSPMFLYWDTVFNLELTGLIFVRAHRERNFLLYLKKLQLCHGFLPWITITMLDGCLCIKVTWKTCQHRFTMNFMRMVIGLFRKPKIAFWQCPLTRLMNKTMPWWKGLVVLLDLCRILLLSGNGYSLLDENRYSSQKNLKRCFWKVKMMKIFTMMKDTQHKAILNH